MSVRSPYSKNSPRAKSNASQVERLAEVLTFLRDNPEQSTYPADIKRLSDRYRVHPKTLRIAIQLMVREDWNDEIKG